MDLKSGERFGRLTVIRKDGVYKKPCGTTQSKYLCQCDCGKQITVLRQNLHSGNTKSCGCIASESRARQLKPENKGVINAIILGYKRHAKERGLMWDLSFDQVKDIINKPCFYCGEEKSNRITTKNCKGGYSYNGIDRIDSKKGYIFTNVVPCCKKCNSAKSDMELKEFILWVQKAASHIQAMAEQWGEYLDEE